jgi:hypothetical protein
MVVKKAFINYTQIPLSTPSKIPNVPKKGAKTGPKITPTHALGQAHAEISHALSQKPWAF